MAGPVDLVPYGAERRDAVVALWNAAIGEHFPLDPRVLDQVTGQNPSFLPTDARVALDSGRVVGFGYLGRHRGTLGGRRPWEGVGWLQAVVVDPGSRRRGIGRSIVRDLLDGARADGLRTIGIGGGIHYFFPAVPTELPDAGPFLAAVGAIPDDESWAAPVDPVRAAADARAAGHRIGVTWDLRGPLERPSAANEAGEVLTAAGLILRPLGREPGERAVFLARLADGEFGTDWLHDMTWFLDHGGDPAAILLLRRRDSDAISGLVRIVVPDDGPIPPQLFWRALLGPRPGGLGPIGIGQELRGRGLGRALLALALGELHRRGAREVVVDWTVLLDYYGEFGIRPWKTYIEGSLPFPGLEAAR
jgi:predicted N-acetyltransferase YhbS